MTTPAPMPTRPSAPLHVLLVEDNRADARLVREMLAEATPGEDPWAMFCLEDVARLADALIHLAANPVDIVLLDLSLPDGQGLDVLRRVRAAAPGVAIVVMSGNDDEALALAGVRDGAQDYLVKGRVEGPLLVRVLRYACERQQAEGRLAATVRALEAKTREQEAFIYTMSHDLKAPLISLHGMATVLIEDYADHLDPTGHQYLDRIAANAQKMQALIDELLALSRVGRDAAATTVVDLGAVVRTVTSQLAHSLAARGAEVQVEGSLPFVTANPTRLAQVFTNLIDNAVTYTPADRAPRIMIAARARGERIAYKLMRLNVHDRRARAGRALGDRRARQWRGHPDGLPRQDLPGVPAFTRRQAPQPRWLGRRPRYRGPRRRDPRGPHVGGVRRRAGHDRLLHTSQANGCDGPGSSHPTQAERSRPRCAMIHQAQT